MTTTTQLPWRRRNNGRLYLQPEALPPGEGPDAGELAELVGVRRETIMRLEKAQYNPSLKLAVDIARAVETPLEELFVFE